MPCRPGYQIIGTEVVLRPNYFSLIPKPGILLYPYAVDVHPEPGATSKQKRAFSLLTEGADFP